MGCIPWAECSPATAMPDAHEQQVALANRYLLGHLGPGEVVGSYVFARLEPGPAGQPGNIEQDTAADDPVAGHLDRQLRRA